MHSQTGTPDRQDQELAELQRRLKRSGSLTIWFNPAMTWDAAPSSKHGRRRTFIDAARQTCLTMKVLFALTLRQTKGFAQSLLRRVGLNRSVPDYSALSSRQKALKFNFAGSVATADRQHRHQG